MKLVYGIITKIRFAIIIVVVIVIIIIYYSDGRGTKTGCEKRVVLFEFSRTSLNYKYRNISRFVREHGPFVPRPPTHSGAIQIVTLRAGIPTTRDGKQQQ